MEFLDISLTKDSRLLLHAIHNLRKPYSTLVLKSTQKNPRKKKTWVYSWMAFCVKWKNEGIKLDKKSSLRRLEFMPQNLD